MSDEKKVMLVVGQYLPFATYVTVKTLLQGVRELNYSV